MLVLAAPERDHVLDAGALLDGVVGVRFQGHDLAAAPGAVRRDQDLGFGVVDPIAKRVGAEAAEHHRVGSADPSAREHRDRQLGHHAEIDVHPVALLHPERSEPVREPADLLEQIPGRRSSVCRPAHPPSGRRPCPRLPPRRGGPSSSRRRSTCLPRTTSRREGSTPSRCPSGGSRRAARPARPRRPRGPGRPARRSRDPRRQPARRSPEEAGRPSSPRGGPRCSAEARSPLLLLLGLFIALWRPS